MSAADSITLQWDSTVCNSYGACVLEAPEVFSLADNGALVIATLTPSRELEDKLRDACAMCPTQALSIVEPT